MQVRPMDLVFGLLFRGIWSLGIRYLGFDATTVGSFTYFDFLVDSVRISGVACGVFVRYGGSFMFVLFKVIVRFFMSFSSFNLLPALATYVVRGKQAPLLLLRLLLLVLPSKRAAICAMRGRWGSSTFVFHSPDGQRVFSIQGRF